MIADEAANKARGELSSADVLTQRLIERKRSDRVRVPRDPVAELRYE
jgi:hypothetical protein